MIKSFYAAEKEGVGMTVEEMKQKKLEKGYSYAQLSQLSGIPLGTVQKIFSGETEHPRFATLQALEKVLQEYPEKAAALVLNDSAVFSYGDRTEKKPGEYTVKDYFALPKERRVELIDGVFYDMAVPTFAHQSITGELHRQIANFILDNNGSCQVVAAPIDVQLDRDDKTMVQPDVLILCDPDKILQGRVFGAPDFVLEVISLSTKRNDYFKKLAKYENAGVREYWIMDPFKKQLIVFFFEEDIYAQIHNLSESVPVHIYEGKLQIHFEHIRRWCNDAGKDGGTDMDA